MASDIPESVRGYLGKGLKTPIEVDPRTGGLKTTSGEDIVKESIIRIIGTSRGQRVMNRTFGADVMALLFEPANADTESSLIEAVERAIYEHEPRVRSLRVDTRIDGTTIYLSIQYRVVGSSKPRNLVFPFFLEEGT